MSFLSVFKDTFYSAASCCFPNPTIQVNKRTFKVIRLLGEGKTPIDRANLLFLL
ncbi:hypothetical protein BDF14DRAFT_1800884 [Spinellus fusiger]|nr:hypothetical protein BDF14DRAFT_1800884 [Spinellus fusiger]